MGPGGEHYQGHSDFQRTSDCKDDGVYAPISGELTWIDDQRLHITLSGVSLVLNPDNPPEFTEELRKVISYDPHAKITFQMAHLKKARENGKVNAEDLIGYLTYEAYVPMIGYQIQIGFTVWSPALFQWEIQPICLEHCEAKLNNYYKR